MRVGRRDFLRDGIAAVALALAARSAPPRAAGAPRARTRQLVLLHLCGGNDALSMVVPYADPFYYRRRPSIAVPARRVLPIGTDSAGRALGLHPGLRRCRDIFEQGQLAIVQRAGYPDASRSHLEAAEVWNAAWVAAERSAPRFDVPRGASCSGLRARPTCHPASRLKQALSIVAGSIGRHAGRSIFLVQTAGYDTHSAQGACDGAYGTLMAALDDALGAFHEDLRSRRLLDDTLVLQFSEFGRCVGENTACGTDHGAAGTMLAIGGGVRGGIYGAAGSLDPDPANADLQDGGRELRYETDFRTVYACVLDAWLGVDPAGILGGDFRDGAPAIVRSPLTASSS